MAGESSFTYSHSLVVAPAFPCCTGPGFASGPRHDGLPRATSRLRADVQSPGRGVPTTALCAAMVLLRQEIHRHMPIGRGPCRCYPPRWSVRSAHLEGRAICETVTRAEFIGARQAVRIVFALDFCCNGVYPSTCSIDRTPLALLGVRDSWSSTSYSLVSAGTSPSGCPLLEAADGRSGSGSADTWLPKTTIRLHGRCRC